MTTVAAGHEERLRRPVVPGSPEGDSGCPTCVALTTAGMQEVEQPGGRCRWDPLIATDQGVESSREPAPKPAASWRCCGAGPETGTAGAQ
jgi:hypothetical protein